MTNTRTPLLIGTLALLIAGLLLFSGSGAADVEAARGGGGGGKGSTKSTPTLSVSPNPLPAGTQSILITGTGFPANETLWLDTGHVPQPTVTTDASGFFSMVYYHEYGPGQAGVAAYLPTRRGMTLLAYTTFTICSTDPC